MLVECNDRTRRARVRVLVENHGGFVIVRNSAEHPLRDQLVHLEVRLVQPESSNRRRVEIKRCEVCGDVVSNHRADLTEHHLTVLTEYHFVRIAFVDLSRVEKAEVVADVVRELRCQLRAEHFPTVRNVAEPVGDHCVSSFKHQCGACIAKDEMEIAQLEVVVPGRDLGVDDHHALRRSVSQCIDRCLDRERRRRARHVHVVRPTASTECVLDLDGHRRVGALQVRAANNHCIDIAALATSLGKGFANGGQGHLGLNAQLVFGARFEPRPHPVGVEHAGLLHDIPRLDTRGFDNERLVRSGTRLHRARLDLSSVRTVPLLNRRSQRSGQFCIADRLGWCEQTGPCDRH